MGKADLHIHTTASYDGTATPAATLEYVRSNTNLDVIAVTDHDSVDGALLALELAPRYGVEVIPGVEVSTADGHLLALFVKKDIPRNLSLLKTVEYVAGLGGICIVPHPGGHWNGSVQEEAICTVLQDATLSHYLVGIETYNASLPRLETNEVANAINGRLQLASVGNSDSHMLWTIGQGWTEFEGRTAADLRSALLAKQTRAMNKQRPWSFYPSYVQTQLLRSAGIVNCLSDQAEGKILRRWLPELPIANPIRQMIW
jgi:predicted metal-dependent phosphoesterase TrpH